MTLVLLGVARLGAAADDAASARTAADAAALAGAADGRGARRGRWRRRTVPGSSRSRGRTGTIVTVAVGGRGATARARRATPRRALTRAATASPREAIPYDPIVSPELPGLTTSADRSVRGRPPSESAAGGEPVRDDSPSAASARAHESDVPRRVRPDGTARLPIDRHASPVAAADEHDLGSEAARRPTEDGRPQRPRDDFGLRPAKVRRRARRVKRVVRRIDCGRCSSSPSCFYTCMYVVDAGCPRDDLGVSPTRPA